MSSWKHPASWLQLPCKNLDCNFDVCRVWDLLKYFNDHANVNMNKCTLWNTNAQWLLTYSIHFNLLWSRSLAVCFHNTGISVTLQNMCTRRSWIFRGRLSVDMIFQFWVMWRWLKDEICRETDVFVTKRNRSYLASFLVNADWFISPETRVYNVI